MATEMINLRLETNLLQDIDSFAKSSGFQSRTEFIRQALRDKLEDIRMKEAMILSLRGRGTLKTTDEDLHQIREKVVAEFEKKLK